jgi:hypothetical protein
MNGIIITALIYQISLSSRQNNQTRPYAIIFRSTFFDKNPSLSKI